jgi:hypothetical protein
VVVGVLACGRAPTPAPSSPYVGFWSGSLSDDSAGEGAWQMTLSEVTTLAGSATLTLGGQVVNGAALELPPPPLSSGRFLSLNCGPSGGRLVVNISVTGDTLSGTYQSIGCAGFSAGLLRGRRGG